MPTWPELEKRFLELEVQLRGARLDYQGGAAGEYWRVAASSDRIVTSRFEAVSKLAGRKLLADAGAEEALPFDLRGSLEDVTRWYRAMKLNSGHYECGFVGYQTNEDGSYAGAIVSGSIRSPAAVAATLCLELSTMEKESPDPSSPLTIHVSGINARINIGSTDNSTNSYTSNTTAIFERLREAVADHVPAEQRPELLNHIDRMEKAVETPNFISRYNEFIQSAANHIAVFGPMLPALSALLKP